MNKNFYSLMRSPFLFSIFYDLQTYVLGAKMKTEHTFDYEVRICGLQKIWDLRRN